MWPPGQAKAFSSSPISIAERVYGLSGYIVLSSDVTPVRVSSHKSGFGNHFLSSSTETKRITTNDNRKKNR
jgi:hypothetical protein